MKQYETYELTFEGPKPIGSNVQVDLKAVFTNDEKSTEVAGFYAGNGQYKVRFYPERAGHYTWKVTGVVQAQGQVNCEPAQGHINGKPAQHKNEVVQVVHNHGMVHVRGLHFQYADGTWYYPFGTTIYAMVHQEESLVNTTMNTLQTAPFNKVRFCVFPKHYDFNHNEPKYYAFEKTDGKWDVHKPCFAFWEELEKRIKQLDTMGIQGDLILFHPYDRWGFADLSKEDSLVYLDYLLRRLSAFPNLWWSMANEYDLMHHYNWEDWEEFAKFIKTHDPYGHLLSNHNCFAYWDFTQQEITHCSIQDINVNEVPELQRKYHKPVVFDECRYEGNIIHSWGNLSAKEMTHRFWTAVVYGGYCTHGETYYSEDEILWWARGGVLKGESPARIAFLREIVEALPGPLELVEEGLGSITVDMIEEMKINGVPEELRNDFFVSHLVNLPRERILFFILRHRACFGHCGNEAYLRYYEKECTSIGAMDLPKEENYKVEVIDTFEMTRKVVAENVSGLVKIDLPGKEGMAVFATKM